MQMYNVALWLSWPSLFPEYVEDVTAFDHFTAVESVMQRSGLSRVVRAAAAHQGVIRRYSRVVLQHPQEQEVR
jgi:hypothetical protein